MKTVGLTGGIGSGKSTVAEMFRDLGVAVYIADIEAKQLMQTSAKLRREIIEVFGKRAYPDGQLDRAWLAAQTFGNKELLEKLNALVHPAVQTHFEEWKSQQQGVYVLKEAAILFETGSYKKCDKTILVTAPEAVRINRVTQRDGVDETVVRARIQHQWPDAKKRPLADFVIENKEGKAMLKKQISLIHHKLLTDFI